MAEVVVVGAGMGALAGAARLAVAGHRVTVYERGATHGGAVGRLTRDGFAFDTGPGLLQLPAVWRDLFIKTGRERLEDVLTLRQVDPAARHLFADGTAVTLGAASRARAIEALDAALGDGSGERWTALVGRAREAWDATRRPLLEEPYTAAGPPPAALRDPYPARGRGLLRRRTPTLAEVAAAELGDPRLEAMAGGYAELAGLDPRTAPASATVLAYLEQTFGSWYVAGGMRALADAVYERCRSRRVAFHFGTAVRRIRVAGGRATGVELADGTEVAADAVVDGTGALTGGPRPVAGGSRHTLFLALRGARPADTPHLTLVHGDGPVVSVLRPDDPATVPDAGHEAVTVSVPVPAGTEPGAAGAERLLAAAERAVPELRTRLLWQESRTPADWAELTGAPGGAIPPPALAGARPARAAEPNLGTVRGSYALGGWAHPGGGLAHAGMSGALVAGLITEGETFRGSR